MALYDFDSFDYYQSENLPQVYNNCKVWDGYSGSSIVPGGTCGTNRLLVHSDPGQGGPARGAGVGDTTIVFGARVEVPPGGLPVLFQIICGPEVVQNVCISDDGALYGVLHPDFQFPPVNWVSNGGLVTMGVPTHIGMKIHMDGAPNGSVTIAINGKFVQTITGISTQIGSMIPWTGIRLGGRGFGAPVYFDDFYLGDTLGPAPWNDLLGDVHVQYLREIAPGDLTQFALTGAPSNWQAVLNSDVASYVQGNSVGLIDTYKFEDLAVVTGNVIFGVKASLLAYTDVPGPRRVTMVKRQTGTNYLDPNPLALTSGTGNYSYAHSVMMKDPKTGAQWASEAAINATSGNQFGMQITT